MLKKKPPLNDQRKAQGYCFTAITCVGKINENRSYFRMKNNVILTVPTDLIINDLSKEERFLARLQSREGSVIIWDAVCYYETFELQFTFLEFSKFFGAIAWTAQCSDPRRKGSKYWITAPNVSLLKWAPYSSDLIQ